MARTNHIGTRDPISTPTRIKVSTQWRWGEKDGVIPIGDANAFRNGLLRAPMVGLPGLSRAPFEKDPIASLKPVQRFLFGAT